MGRNYRDSDLKVLWGAQARCAFPGCRTPLVVPATAVDPARVIGKIAHIVAHSDDGPRGDPTFTEEDRDKPDNLILLCGTHHDVVDVQPNTYTVGDLRRWKEEHEAWVDRTLSDAVVALTFNELEAVTAALVATPPRAIADLQPPAPPQEKMRHNELTQTVAHYYQMGQLRFFDVEDFISSTSSFDPDFGDRLKAGFTEQYQSLRDRGMTGDDLYIALAEWASGGWSLRCLAQRRVLRSLAISSMSATSSSASQQPAMPRDSSDEACTAGPLSPRHRRAIAPGVEGSADRVRAVGDPGRPRHCRDLRSAGSRVGSLVRRRAG